MTSTREMQVWRNWELTCGHVQFEMNIRNPCRAVVELYDLGDVWIGDVNMGIVGIQIAFVLVWVPLEADPNKLLAQEFKCKQFIWTESPRIISRGEMSQGKGGSQ